MGGFVCVMVSNEKGFAMFASIRSFLLVLAIPIVLCGCEATNMNSSASIKDRSDFSSVAVETCFFAPVDLGEEVGIHMRRLCFKNDLLGVYVTQYGSTGGHI